MSDCDWMGMSVFGTQVLAPGPADLPSTVLTRAAASMAINTVTEQAGLAYTTVTTDGTNPLTAVLTRKRTSNPILVTLNVTGTAATGSSDTISDLRFKVIAADNTILTRPGGDTLLCAACRIDPTLTPPLLRFSIFIRTLVPASLLPQDVDLDFFVQFKFITTVATPPTIRVDAAPDVLVVEEIGALTL